MMYVRGRVFLTVAVFGGLSLITPNQHRLKKPSACDVGIVAGKKHSEPLPRIGFSLFFHFGFMIFTLIDCYNQVETVFHEFGHALQYMLTKQDEGLVSSSQGIENDVVKLTYQFMENWCCQRKEADGIRIDVALQWCSDAYSDTMLGYANSIRTIDGGTHIDGMKASLTRTLNNLGKKSKIFQENDISLSGEHVREGLTCVISVKVANPKFEGQTKGMKSQCDEKMFDFVFCQKFLGEM